MFSGNPEEDHFSIESGFIIGSFMEELRRLVFLLEEAASFILGLFFGVGIGYGISQLDKRKEKQRLEESVMEEVLSEDDKGRDPANSHENAWDIINRGSEGREEDEMGKS